MACSTKAKKITAGVLMTLGFLFIGLAILLPWIINNKVEQGIADNTLLTSTDSEGFKMWSDNSKPDSIPSFKSFYLFDVTNVPDIVNKKAKPVLKQVGPFTVRNLKIRFDATWTKSDDGLNVINYKEWEYFEFEPSKSCASCTLDTPVTMLNLVTQGVLAKSPLGVPFFNFMCPRNANCSAELTVDGVYSPFSRLTAGEWLFGYHSWVLDTLPAGKGRKVMFDGLAANTTSMEAARNASYVQSLYVGDDDAWKVRQYYKWNGNSTILVCDPKSTKDCTPESPLSDYVQPWGEYPDGADLQIGDPEDPETLPDPNVVVGTDGTAYHRDVREGSYLLTFVDNLARWVFLKNTAKVQHHALDLLRFTIRQEDMQPVSQNPINQPWYVLGHPGVMNLTAVSGMPSFVTKPHFYQADKELFDGVKGLDSKPTEDKYQTFLDVEPYTGMTLNAHKRLQINFDMAKVNDITAWKEIATPPLMPVFWLDEFGSLPEDKSQQLADTLYGAAAAKKGIQYGGFIGGGILVIVGLILVFTAGRQAERQREDSQYHQFSDLSH